MPSQADGSQPLAGCRLSHNWLVVVTQRLITMEAPLPRASPPRATVFKQSQILNWSTCLRTVSILPSRFTARTRTQTQTAGFRARLSLGFILPRPYEAGCFNYSYFRGLIVILVFVSGVSSGVWHLVMSIYYIDTNNTVLNFGYQGSQAPEWDFSEHGIRRLSE
jgi:hypothetical protein